MFRKFSCKKRKFHISTRSNVRCLTQFSGKKNDFDNLNIFPGIKSYFSILYMACVLVDSLDLLFTLAKYLLKVEFFLTGVMLFDHLSNGKLTSTYLHKCAHSIHVFFFYKCILFSPVPIT